jgi:UDP-N-acetylmuramoyl-tripeptide--D-alanyl-D-alanine ligase
MGISDFGDMSRLAEMVRPDIFIMTAIGYAHLKELGDLNGVLKAKTEAFAYMKPDGTAVLNGDDELLRGYEPGMRKITFGLGESNDFRAVNIRAESTDAVRFDIESAAGRFPVELPAYGVHLAPLAASAAAIGHLFEMTGDEIGRGLSAYAPVGGRSNVTSTGAIRLIDDCYNANPNSVRAALSSLSALQGRRTAILGDMINLGEQAKQLHREVGAFAAQSRIDSLICCGEEALDIYEGYSSAGMGDSHYFPSKADLIPALPGLIKKGDAVLVKASRGMHFEELLPVLKVL